MLLKIERMNHTGDGIGSGDGIIYFIPKTIPGDIVEIKEKDIIKHKNYNQVFKYKLLEQSDKRVKAPCPYYKECGGCQIMELNQKEQLKYKKEKVIDIFKKYTNIEVNPNILKTKELKYRNKITLQVEKGIIGLYSENTHKLIPITKCLLVPDNLNEIINKLQKLDLSQVKQIILKTIQKEIMVHFIGNIKKEEAIQNLSSKVQSIYLNDKLIFGLPYLKESLSKYKFNISPKSFFQINYDGTIIIYNKVKEYLENENNVLDLYCGTGTIGIYISDKCKKITGIEINDSSVANAKENIKLNHIKNIKIIKGNVGTILEEKEKYDAIIVDPPRSGLDKQTLSKLQSIKSKKIIYISCNPITLARDINILKETYYLKEITLVDMFPNTYHVESIALLNVIKK